MQETFNQVQDEISISETVENVFFIEQMNVENMS